MRDVFFNQNFLNARGILAQRIYNARAIFCQFCDVKDTDDPNSQASSVSWFPVSPKAPELIVLSQSCLPMNKFI